MNKSSIFKTDIKAIAFRLTTKKNQKIAFNYIFFQFQVAYEVEWDLGVEPVPLSTTTTTTSTTTPDR